MAEIGWQQPPSSVTDPELRQFLSDVLRIVQSVKLLGNNIGIYAGSGTPEGVITARVGSLFLRTDAATTLYVKQTGDDTNTGWVVK